MNRLLRTVIGVSTLSAVLTVAAFGSTAAAAPNCSQVDVHGLKMEQNLHASHVLVKCGEVPGGNPNVTYGSAATAGTAPPELFGTDVNLITGNETLPHVTQSESMMAVHGNDVVVSYNDSRAAASTQYSGVSVSHDGGGTFTRLNPSPFATGHANNFGDPIVVYNQKLDQFFAGDLASGCGGQGVGLWASTNGDTWTAGACAVTETNADRESMWVDNNPASAFYGRMYISWNDFNVSNAAIKVTHSDDGTSWSSPVTLNPAAPPGFLRQVEVTGSPGSDGAVFEAALDEGGGGCCTANEQNYMFKSTDGGATWSSTATSAIPGTFKIPGDSLCSGSSYFPKIAPIWRETGYGVPGVGPGDVVQYVYAAHGASTDPGDVYYVRSTDNGATWHTPVKLNTDATTTAQWMPSLTVTQGGIAAATWYDRRNTTDGASYQRFVRFSTDNGATWGPDQPLSTQLIPQPNQPDPNVQSCYAGDYSYSPSGPTNAFDAWTDGRVSIGVNGPQQDVFLHQLVGNLSVATAGSGTGTVASAPAGINCPGDCSESYTADAGVSLTAEPGSGSRFAGWSGGGCSGTGTCQVTMSSDQAVTATFVAVHTLAVSKSGTGGGSVASSPAGIDCGSTCSAHFDEGAPVILTATPAADSTFTGWSGGGCSGTGTCTVTMDADKTVTATFNPTPPPTHSLTVAKSGAGSGSVTSSPAGIDCGSSCSHSFTAGISVTLSATPNSGSTFAGWSGGGCSGTGTCTVTMNSDQSVAAAFNDATPPNTTIIRGPPRFTRDATPTFAFRSSELGSTFRCKRDKGLWAACKSPRTTLRLANGIHVFYVRAIDRAANVDPTPAKRVFRVDTRAPASKAKAPASARRAPIAITYTASDPAPSSGLSAVELWVLRPGQRRYAKAATDATPNATHAFAYWPTAGAGTYRFYTRAKDRAGNYEKAPLSPDATTVFGK